MGKGALPALPDKAYLPYPDEYKHLFHGERKWLIF